MTRKAELVADHSDYVAAVISESRRWLGLREEGNNRGVEIERWLSMVRAKPGDPWCAALVYGNEVDGAKVLGLETNLPRSASACGFWIRGQAAGLLCIRAEHLRRGLVYPEPGDVFIRARRGRPEDVAKILRGHFRKGHCGRVLGLDENQKVHTREGNTNGEGSREGDGVYDKVLDLWMPELVGIVRPTFKEPV